jgi:N-acetylmuramic acid 6-phosphate etherase
MLRHLTDCTQPQAEAALKQADGSIKLAALLLRGQSVGLQPAQARSLLALCNGRLGQAFERLGQPAATRTCNG